MLADVPYEIAWTISAPYMNHPDGNIPFENLPTVFHALGFDADVQAFDADNAPYNGLCEIRYADAVHTVWHYVVWNACEKRFYYPQKTVVDTFEVVRFLKITQQTISV